MAACVDTLLSITIFDLEVYDATTTFTEHDELSNGSNATAQSDAEGRGLAFTAISKW